MKEVDNSVKITKYRRKHEFNVGVLIFVIIFIYILATLISYHTRTRVVSFEVRQGRVLTDHSYIGVAIREELVIPMESTGYVYYFQNNLSKVRLGADLLAVSSTPIPLEDESVLGVDANVQMITNTNHYPFLAHTQSFVNHVDLQRFSTVQTFRQDLLHSFHGTVNQVRTAQFDGIMGMNPGDVNLFQAPIDGILVMRVDGMEGLTKDEITVETFNRYDYRVTLFTDEVHRHVGEPAYKLVTSENWYVVIQVEENIANQLRDLTWTRIRFLHDDVITWTNPTVFNRGGQDFVAFALSHSMIRYADERFIHIELILEDQSGLQIPRSALIEKEFFRVPRQFLVSMNASTGIVRINEEGEEEFTLVRIYYSTPEGDIYVNPNEVPRGSTLIIPDTGETTQLLLTEPLVGVFNINRGYAIFQMVNIISESENYYIVEEGNAFSVSNFDFIAFDGTSVEDGEIIAR